MSVFYSVCVALHTHTHTHTHTHIHAHARIHILLIVCRDEKVSSSALALLSGCEQQILSDAVPPHLGGPPPPKPKHSPSQPQTTRCSQEPQQIKLIKKSGSVMMRSRPVQCSSNCLVSLPGCGAHHPASSTATATHEIKTMFRPQTMTASRRGESSGQHVCWNYDYYYCSLSLNPSVLEMLALIFIQR